jgi:hypothetical protein
MNKPMIDSGKQNNSSATKTTHPAVEILLLTSGRSLEWQYGHRKPTGGKGWRACPPNSPAN